MSPMQSLPRPIETYHTKTYDRIAKNHGFDGAGKTVVVTGGASGVGLSITKAFAGAGVARIAIISRSAETQEEAKSELNAFYPSTEILTFQASVTDTKRTTEILQEIGSIDVLVLCAAVAHLRAPSLGISVEEVQDAFNTNTVAPFALTKAYLSMTTPQKKTVLNVSSAAAQLTAGLRVGYGPSKAAAVQMFHHLAAEHKEEEVRFVSFHPGALWTPGTEKAMGKMFPRDAPLWEDINLPAHFALWLAGPESGFLHGRYVWAQWDVDELIAIKDRLTAESNALKIGLIL